jgi:hypothetical protein
MLIKQSKLAMANSTRGLARSKRYELEQDTVLNEQTPLPQNSLIA